MLPVLMLLFGFTSVSSAGLKKAIADRYFSLLAGEVTGERHSQGLRREKPTGTLNQQTIKDQWGHILITAQMNLGTVWGSSLRTSSAVMQ